MKGKWIYWQALVLSLLMLCLSASSCAEGQKERLVQNGFEYEVEENGSARILGYNGDRTELVIPSRMGDAAVKEIGEGAFAENERLQSITLADGIQCIGKGAFENCTALEEVSLPESMTSLGHSAFSGCSKLLSIDLPEGLKEIGESCFSECGLRTAQIPGNVESIGRAAFAECAFLSEVEIGEGTRFLGAKAFSGCKCLSRILLPESLQSVGTFAFEDCGMMERIDLGKNLVTVGENPFVYCYALKEISIAKENAALVFKDGLFIDQAYNRLIASLTAKQAETCQLPDDLTEIGGYAFAMCKRLRQIRMPQHLRVIGQGAFYGCTELAALEIPAGVEKIGDNPFEGCMGLSSLMLSPQNKHFRCEDGMLMDVENRSVIAGIPGMLSSTVLIPEGMERIGNRAFRACVIMTELTIPDGVRSIGERAFYECFRLKRVFISSRLDSVGSDAFMDGQNSMLDIVETIELALYGINAADSPMLYLEQGGAALDYAIEHNVSYLIVNPLTISAMAQQTLWSGYTLKDSVERMQLLEAEGSYESINENVILYEDEDVQVMTMGISFYADGTPLQQEVEGEDTGGVWHLCVPLIVRERTNCSVSIDMDMDVLVDEYAMNGYLSALVGHKYYLLRVSRLDSGNRIRRLSDISTIVLPAMTVKVNGEERATIRGMTLEAHEGAATSEFYANIGDGILKYVFDGAGLRITRYLGKGDSVVIPDKIENRTFTAIDDGAFDCCSRIKIPATITSMGKNAISNPESVTVEVYPESYADLWAQEQRIKTLYIPSEFEKDGIKWKVLEDQVLQVMGTTEDREILEIPGNYKGMPVVYAQNLSGKSLTKVIIGEGVQVIGKEVFAKSGALTEVVLPQSLTEIGDGAFSGCESLQSIQLPEKLSSIGEEAFLNCRSIKRLSIGKAAVSIGKRAFSGMTALAAIDVHSGNPAYAVVDGVLFRKEDRTLVLYPSAKADETYTVPPGIESIEQDSIACVSCLKAIEIPSSVREIGDGVLQDMPKLETVVLNDGIQRIGSDVLTKCPKITRLVIPGSVSAIGDSSFCEMSSLRVCIFEEGVQQIGGHVLWEDHQLALIQLPESLKEVGDSFANKDAENPVYIVVEDGSYAQLMLDNETYYGHIWMVQKNGTDEQGMTEYEDENCRSIYYCEQGESILVLIREGDGVTLSRVYSSGEGTVEIPDTAGGMPVTAIGEYAFKYAQQLSEIILSDSVLRVGKEAFRSMENLTNLVLPDGIMEIGSDAFRGTGLRSLTLPGSLRIITEGLAAGMGGMDEVIIGEGIEEIRDGAIDLCFPERVTLPASLEIMSGDVFTAGKTDQFLVVKGSKAESLCKAYGYSYSYQEGGSAGVTQSDEGEGEIIFPSPEAEAVVRYKLQKQEGPIYPEDVKDITEISFNGTGINSIEFLRHFTGLKRLCLGEPVREPEWSWIKEVGLKNSRRNTFTDLSPIAGLQQLEELDLSFSDVKDLSLLSGLVNLKSLTLRHSYAYDFSPLGTLSGLETLVLWESGITDISCLSGLEHLEYLDLNESRVTSLLPLGEIQSLQYLHLMECLDATNYEVLLDMPALKEIWCDRSGALKYGEQLGDRLKP